MAAFARRADTRTKCLTVVYMQNEHRPNCRRKVTDHTALLDE